MNWRNFMVHSNDNYKHNESEHCNHDYVLNELHMNSWWDIQLDTVHHINSICSLTVSFDYSTTMFKINREKYVYNRKLLHLLTSKY